MSLVKPPDPELLKGMSVKDQRDLMAQHAQHVISQKSAPSSRRASNTSLTSASSSLRASNTSLSALDTKDDLTKDLNDVKSILKSEAAGAKSDLHGILKSNTTQSDICHDSSGGSTPRGILRNSKQDEVVHSGEALADVRSILKHEDETTEPTSRSRSNSQPHGILKHEDPNTETHGILKHDNEIKIPIDNENKSEIKSILKGQESCDNNVDTEISPEISDSEDLVIVETYTVVINNDLSTDFRLDGVTTSTSTDDTPIRLDTSTTDDTLIKLDTAIESTGDTLVKLNSTPTEDTLITVDTTNECTDFALIQVDSTNESTVNTPIKVDNITACDKSSLQPPTPTGVLSTSEGDSSSGELLDESTPRRRRSRRRFNSKGERSCEERYKTQPVEQLDTSNEESAKRKFKYEGRHKTQPITPTEMKEATESTASPPARTFTPGGSIADRLNLLKSSGEDDWRRRVRKDDDLPLSDSVVRLREKSGSPVKRPTSIADRLNDLSNSQASWKDRVGETDAKQFTVSAKMGVTKVESPLLNKRKALIKDDVFKSNETTPTTSPSTPSKEFISKIPIPTDLIADLSVEPEKTQTKSIGSSVKQIDRSAEEDDKKEGVKVTVPVMGEDVDNFFATKSIDKITEKVTVEIDDFNNIFCEAEEILPSLRKARPKRKTRPSSMNPLKSKSTIEIQQEYTEVKLGTAEKEFKRMKKEKISKDAGFAQEALAGLASKENFKQFKLNRSDSGTGVHGQLDPFKETMLLHVKGRRMVQTRLVEPHKRSLNAGDCFVLITPDRCMTWEGQYANVIEKAKAADIAGYVITKKDMGCKKAVEVNNLTQAKGNFGPAKIFFKALEGEMQCQDCGVEAEDELHENKMVRSNMIYRMEGNSLKPYTEYWGTAPKYDMLKRTEVIVFDFGTEFYLWQGKAVTMDQRKTALKLAKKLYDKGYDFSEAAINPFSPTRSIDDGGLPVKAATRPKWCIFGKVNQNMETVLFREKFSDWPDKSRIITVKSSSTSSETTNKELQEELKPYDAKQMIQTLASRLPVTLKLDGEHVGRGLKWTEDMQGFIKEKEIITRDVAVWHVMEYDIFKMPQTSYGQFHDGDTYVVRWSYMMSNANLRSLKGKAARNSLSGRERCAYFFWQGNNSSINEKGASALMTVELDEERGPQVRVLEGKEPPCFLNLFDGKMIVHIGKREDAESNTQGPWRLYCLRGDYENEAYLLEIPVSIEHLRSRSSSVILNVNTGMAYLWHGSKSSIHTRKTCQRSLDKLAQEKPAELGLHPDASVVVTEIEEGEECSALWEALGDCNRKIYHSLYNEPRKYEHQVRLFHMSSVNLTFEVHEQLNPTRCPDLTTPFPFLQSDLYKSTQPALFLVDNGREVYLWQGWWPVGSHEHDNVHTGSATARFNSDRRCAMETTLHYCREKNPNNPPVAYLVCAGMEPTCFTSLFPYWMLDNIVRDLAQEEGRKLGYKEPVESVLKRLTQTRYSLEELHERPLPDGVDPNKLEKYLHDEEFEKLFEMTREEYQSQPPWKQRQMKQQFGLF